MSHDYIIKCDHKDKCDKCKNFFDPYKGWQAGKRSKCVVCHSCCPMKEEAHNWFMSYWGLGKVTSNEFGTVNEYGGVISYYDKNEDFQ